MKSENLPDLPKPTSVVITDDIKFKFLVALGQTGNIMTSAQRSGASYSGLMRHRKADPDFETAVQEAIEVFKAHLEDKLYERAVEGMKEFKYNKDGDPIIGPDGEHAHSLKVSDKLFELLIKRHMPEYREKFEHEHRVSGGVLLIEQPAPTMEEWQDQRDNKRIIDVDAVVKEKPKSDNS